MRRIKIDAISALPRLNDARESLKVSFMKSALPYCVFRVASLALILSLMGACSKGPVWSAEEKENCKHFFLSLEASRKATQLISKNNTDVPQFGIDDINRYQKTALNEARLVQDSVLEKAQPQLKEHFRSEYQKGLELILRSYDVASSSKSGPPSSGEIDLQVSGVALLKQWTVWLNAHDREIKMPEQSPAEPH